MTTTLQIKYAGSVKCAAGFRSVTITANAEKISDKRVKILEVVDIDGDGVGYNSRTGANRQKYNGHYTAQLEAGKINNLSSCEVVT